MIIMKQPIVIAVISIFLLLFGLIAIFANGVTESGYSELVTYSFLGSLGIEGVRIFLAVLLLALVFGLVLLSKENSSVGLLGSSAVLFAPFVLFGISTLAYPLELACAFIMGIGVLVATKTQHRIVGLAVCVLSLASFLLTGFVTFPLLQNTGILVGLSLMALATGSKKNSFEMAVPLLGFVGAIIGIPHALGLLIVSSFDGVRNLFEDPKRSMLFPLGIFGIIFSILYASEGIFAGVYAAGGAVVLYFFVQLAAQDSQVVSRMGFHFLFVLSASILFVTPSLEIVHSSTVAQMVESSKVGNVAMLSSFEAFEFHASRQPIKASSLQDDSIRNADVFMVSFKDLEKSYPQAIFRFYQSVQDSGSAQLVYQNGPLLLTFPISNDGTISNDGRVYPKDGSGIGRPVPLTKIKSLTSKLPLNDPNSIIAITENVDPSFQKYLFKQPRLSEDEYGLSILVK